MYGKSANVNITVNITIYLTVYSITLPLNQRITQNYKQKRTSVNVVLGRYGQFLWQQASTYSSSVVLEGLS